MKITNAKLIIKPSRVINGVEIFFYENSNIIDNQIILCGHEKPDSHKTTKLYYHVIGTNIYEMILKDWCDSYKYGLEDAHINIVKTPQDYYYLSAESKPYSQLTGNINIETFKSKNLRTGWQWCPNLTIKPTSRGFEAYSMSSPVNYYLGNNELLQMFECRGLKGTPDSWWIDGQYYAKVSYAIFDTTTDTIKRRATAPISNVNAVPDDLWFEDGWWYHSWHTYDKNEGWFGFVYKSREFDKGLVFDYKATLDGKSIGEVYFTNSNKVRFWHSNEQGMWEGYLDNSQPPNGGSNMKIIVALVGDSRMNGGIEAGLYKPEPKSVGYFLQLELGNGYDVRSFSEGGVGVSDSCSNPVWNTLSFQHLKNVQDFSSWWENYFAGLPYEPDKMIIISNYGVADSKVSEWETNKLRFKPSYQNFIDTIKGEHILCFPQPICVWADKRWTNDYLNKCLPMIKSFDEKICDLNTNFPQSLYQTDGIHISELGNKETAKRMKQTIKGGSVQVDPPIEPIGDNMPTIKRENDKLICNTITGATLYSWQCSLKKPNPCFAFGQTIDIPNAFKIDGAEFWCYAKVAEVDTPISNKIVYGKTVPPIVPPIIPPVIPTDNTPIVDAIKTKIADIEFLLGQIK